MHGLIADGRADKYLGVARVGTQASFRVALGVLVARLGGTEAFALFVQLVTLEVVAHTLWTAAFVTPLGSLAPGMAPGAQASFLRHALSRNRRAAIGTGSMFAAATPIASLLGVAPLVWLGFCVSTVAWLEANAAVGALTARFRSVRALGATLVGFGVPTVAVVVAHGRGLDVLATFFWSNAVGHSVAALWMHTALPRGPRGSEVAVRTRAAFRSFGRVAIVGSAANSACTRVQPFVLGGIADSLAVGLFGAANTLVGPVRVVGGALGEVLRPRIALHLGSGDAARGRRVFGRTVAIVLALGAVCIGASLVAGDRISTLVFGSDFAQLGAVLPAAAIFVLVATFAHLVVVWVQTADPDGPARATRWRIQAAVLSVAVVVPACALDGARGAFFAMAIAEGVFLACAWAWSRRRALHRAPLLSGELAPHPEGA